MFQRKSQRYYPTRLASNIASGRKSVSSDTHRPGFIVVETNYRIYAYTGGTFCVVVISSHDFFVLCSEQLISLGPGLVQWHVAMSTADLFGTKPGMVVCGHKHC